jgi:hypothetical protein
VASPTTPVPVVPDYEGACLTGVVPPLLLAPPGGRPDWFPAPLQSARRVVLLVLDGLGWQQIQRHRSLLGNLSAMTGGPITTVAPSTTATALTSLVTGAAPLQHGILGYRMDMSGTIMNTLSWSGRRPDERRRDLRGVFPPRSVQPVPSFCGLSVPVITRAEHADTGFTEAHLGHTSFRGWRAPSSIAVEIRRSFDEGHDFVYAYYDGVDKIAHERGFGVHYEAELRATDHLLGEVLASVPSDVTVAVVADHGQVHTGDDLVELDHDVLALVDHQSGEGRFRWLHAREGRVDDLVSALQRYASIAWIMTRTQVVDEKLFGRPGDPSFLRRLGDVALLPHGTASFEDPDDTGAFPLVCRHGSLTEAEMMVPFLAASV